ncbi:MAG: septum formation initiator family protein [Endomicrobium sp.]|jgi:cell division protein FtsB|nr:septum formation initiator family protein [Endomicrobium sp.]
MKKIRIRYFILIIVVIMLCFNGRNKILLKRFIEQKKIKINIESEKNKNKILKKEIYMLENVEDYIEKYVREKLNVMSFDEIEYRFDL